MRVHFLTMKTYPFIVLLIVWMLTPCSVCGQAPQNPPREAAKAGNYKLAQGDVIAVKVFREPELDSQHRLSQDGTVNFPLLGAVSLTGKTTGEASAHLAALLDKDYLVRPQVSVSVVSYVKQRFVVLGQVQNPGTYAIPDEENLDLLGAIAAAGGFTRLADTGKVILRRNAGGREESQVIDVKSLLNGKGGVNIKVLPNDTISVGERTF